MRWHEAFTPEPMVRVALVAPRPALRDALVRIAEAGSVEIDRIGEPVESMFTTAARRARQLSEAGSARQSAIQPRLLSVAPDLEVLSRSGQADILAGEAQLAEYAADAVVHGQVAAMLGWTPAAGLPALSARLAEVGAAVARLPRPPGVDPPTLSRPGVTRRGFGPLVQTYATAPYADVDITVPAGLAYVVMFGAMFGDVGHGMLLALGALALRAGRPRRLAWLRPYWLFVFGAGLASMLFGLGYGEFFGPTGVVPTLWLKPTTSPTTLLVAGIGLGAVLLAFAYAAGTVNRVREGGWAVALYAPTGLAGALLFLAGGTAVAAWLADVSWVWYVAAGLAVLGLVLAYLGLLAGAGGGAAGVTQATVELFDTVIRLGANVVSFARLAAFGLTHAVLGFVIWDATTALWSLSWLGGVVAVLVFVIGNVLAFTLEALVAGVQALRLEYYELFSRVFQMEGRPFRPWHVPLAAPEIAPEGGKASWSPG